MASRAHALLLIALLAVTAGLPRLPRFRCVRKQRHDAACCAHKKQATERIAPPCCVPLPLATAEVQDSLRRHDPLPAPAQLSFAHCTTLHTSSSSAPQPGLRWVWLPAPPRSPQTVVLRI